MIIQVRFGSAQASLGYQFYDDAGALLGSRVTTGIDALPEEGGYIADATVPSGAVGVYWDSTTSEASEDLREALSAITTAQIRAELATELARIDVATSSRSSHSAADVATAVWAAGTRSLTTFGTLVSDIWAAGTRTLTAAADSAGVTTLLSRVGSALTITGGKVTVGTNDDKTGYALATTPPTAGQVATAVRSELTTELGRIDVPVSSRNATTPPTAGAVATAVRAELATELARVDVAVSSRNATAPDNAGIAAIQAKTDALPTDPADQSLIIAATDALMSRLGTPAGASIAEDIANIEGGGGGGATAEEIADAVCDELLAEHVIPGSVGTALAAASASGDPWATVVPAAYPDGTAGAAIGRLNNTPPEVPVVVIPNPADDESLTVVYCYTENIINARRAGVSLTFKLALVPAKSERLLEVAPQSVVTNAEGFAQISLHSGLRYRVTSAELGLDKTFTPSGDTFDLLTLV